MPEHGQATPDRWRILESFLWHDLPTPADWTAWAARTLPDPMRAGAGTGSAGATRLHAALRSLQAANNGIAADTDEARATLNRLVMDHAVRPRLDRRGVPVLVASNPADAVGLLLVLALEAMGADAWRRFKLCREPACRASFFDGSKPAAKTWCAMRTCGSRNKMRRFRANA